MKIKFGCGLILSILFSYISFRNELFIFKYETVHFSVCICTWMARGMSVNVDVYQTYVCKQNFLNRYVKYLRPWRLTEVLQRPRCTNPFHFFVVLVTVFVNCCSIYTLLLCSVNNLLYLSVFLFWCCLFQQLCHWKLMIRPLEKDVRTKCSNDVTSKSRLCA